MVYVISKKGNPLMPTRNAKARMLLKEKRARVIQLKPFTIQLLYDTTEHTQEITLGIDSGYLCVGFSAITDKKELICGNVELLKGIKDRLYERSIYRRTKRNGSRYRKPRFCNRKKNEGWLAPSIQHKLDSHVRIINKLSKILPITKIVIEVANFDIQKIKNPDIEGTEYQQGEQLGFWNTREYVLHRDNHKCQNPNCKNKDVNPVLEVHHIVYQSNGGSDKPSNLITLCTKCHTTENHKGFLKDWKPKIRSFKDATFMSSIRWKLVNRLKEIYGEDNVKHTYGYLTKKRRIELGIEKTHYNDAFCISGGINQIRIEPVMFKQVKRNNRSLEKFYNAKYIDTRTGKKVHANELNCGRRCRNKDKNGENLKVFRGIKVKKGSRRIRKGKYFYQPNDLVKYNNNIYTVQATGNLGRNVSLKEIKKVPRTELLEPYKFMKGIA